MYAIPNRRMAGDVVSLPLVWETPLRTGNLRDPNGPQTTFGAESFIDEMAVAAKIDPYDFRMKMLTDSKEEDRGFKRARSIAVLKAAAETYGWDSWDLLVWFWACLSMGCWWRPGCLGDSSEAPGAAPADYTWHEID